MKYQTAALLLGLNHITSQELVCRRTPLLRRLNQPGDRLGKKPIGCCPPNDQNGKLYGPDKACCCNKVYRPDTQFCCQPTGQCDDYTEILPLSQSHKCVAIIPEPTCNDVSSFEGPGEVLTCTEMHEIGSTCKIDCDVDNGFIKINMAEPTEELRMNSNMKQDIYQCNNEGGWDIINPVAQKNECCRPQCPPTYPPDTKADFFIVLDKSSSIGLENFQFVKDFMLEIVDTFPLALDKVQLRLSTFNSIVENIFELNESATLPLEDIRNKISAIKYTGRGTLTGDGLEDVLENAINKPSNRQDVKDFVLLVTDGRSKQEIKIRRIVSALKKKNVRILTIGVGDKIRRQELAAIASDPKDENVRMAKDFSELVNQVSWVLSTQCPEYTCD